MLVHHLTSVDGDIVFDIDPDVVGTTAGGTRVADDVTVDEVGLLARAMTYKFAAFGQRIGGAKAGIRPRLLDSHAETMARYCEEIRPMVETGRFLTAPDLGTRPEDFAVLAGDDPSAFGQLVDGVPFEDVVTGRGVVAAAVAWLGDLERRTVAIEGFGTVGAAIAREVVRRGGRVVAVSTLRGAVADSDGFDPEALVDARSEHGERFVRELGLEVHRPVDLHELKVDVLVPGARTGVYTAELADRVQAGAIVPAANAPYTVDGLDRLRRNRIPALPDFVCNGGAVLAYAAPRGLRADEVLAGVEREIAERIDAARLSRMDPYRHAQTLAETFLSTWVPAGHLPDGPPLAP